MLQKNFLQVIRQDLRKNIDWEYKGGVRRFYKHPIKCYGVRTPQVRYLAKKYRKDIEDLNKQELFSLADNLFSSGYNEEATMAIAWLFSKNNMYSQKDFFVFEKWLDNYIDNWSKCDDFSLHLSGPLIDKYPSLRLRLKDKWTEADNKWLRRSSAVSLIRSSSEGYFIENNLDFVFKVAEKLWQAEEEMVRKGCGWMLKAASVKNSEKVLYFLKKNKDKMHRQVLNYALEKYPISVRKKIRYI